jgi:hypothetical protein
MDAAKVGFVFLLIGIIFVACGQTPSRSSIEGRWASTNGVVTFSSNGTVSSGFTNRSEVWAFEGSWQLRDSVLTITTTKSNSVPMRNVAHYKIIRADGQQLVYTSNGQTSFFSRAAEGKQSPINGPR